MEGREENWDGRWRWSKERIEAYLSYLSFLFPIYIYIYTYIHTFRLRHLRVISNQTKENDNTYIRDDWKSNAGEIVMVFRGGQGVRCLGMLGRTTVGKAGGDGGLGWADCWRWRRPFPVLLPRFRVPRPIRKRSVSTTTCCPTTTASSAPLATTAIASLSKWDCASPSSSTLWVDLPCYVIFFQ